MQGGACTFGSQRTTLGTIPQELSTLFLRHALLISLDFTSSRIGWLAGQRALRSNYFYFSSLVIQCTLHNGVYYGPNSSHMQ